MQTDTPWVCPTLCGCSITIHREWSVSPKAAAVGVTEPDTIEPETYTIVRQCNEHAGFATADDLYAALKHFHGTKWSPDTCGCSTFYWWDDREPADSRVVVPLDHPVHTTRCEQHAHLSDHEDHHTTILAENQAKNIAVNAIAEHLNMPPQMVPYAYEVQSDKSRSVVIDHEALGVSASVVASAMKT